jgi:ATP-dependent RNA helicase DeaD
MANTFESLSIRSGLAELLHRQGILEPTAIQAQAIPAILEGRDALAQSQTGTGKTLAYLLPILEKADPASKEVQAVILVPTHELGMQIYGEIQKYGIPLGLRAQSLIGGASLQRQIEKLRDRPQLVVGTPGRVQELIKLRKLRVHQVRTVVIDEADQVFELGNRSEVEDVLKSMLRSRQLLFFSATITEAVRKTASLWMNNPLQLLVEPEQKVAVTLTHESIVSEEREKIDTLRRIIRLLEPASALVFVNDTKIVAEIVEKLKYAGLSIEAIYGDATKQERAKFMSRFREGRLRLLLATDVAARGLDISGLTHVINFDPPPDVEHYVHRAGRTGRMGRTGKVITIVTPQEQFILRKFEKQLLIDIQAKAMSHGRWIQARERDRERDRDRDLSRDQERGRRAPGRASGSAAISSSASSGSKQPESKLGQLQGQKPAPRKARNPEQAPVKSRQPDSRASASNPRKKRALTEQERKNKGAPRWLKDKRDNPQP